MASRKALDASNDLKFSSKLANDRLETQTGLADVKDKTLLFREKNIKADLKDIQNGYMDLKKAQKTMDDDRKELDAVISESNKEIDVARAQVKQAKQDNLDTAKGLDAKQADVDLQFEHVENVRKSNERKIKRLEFLQKGSKS